MKHLNELITEKLNTDSVIFEKLKLKNVKKTIDIIPYFKEYLDLYLDNEYKTQTHRNFENEQFTDVINNFIDNVSKSKKIDESSITFSTQGDNSYCIVDRKLTRKSSSKKINIDWEDFERVWWDDIFEISVSYNMLTYRCYSKMYSLDFIISIE